MLTHLLQFKSFGPALLAGLALFLQPNYTCAQDDKLTVAILDTGFCLEEIKSFKNLEIKKPKNVTSTKVLNCKDNKARQHGTNVLREMVRSFQSEKKIVITPYIIFDSSGVQKLEYWKKALELSAQSDLVFSAAGLKINKVAPNYLSDKTQYFFSSGQVSNDLSKQDKLYPQLFHQQDNVTLVGSFFSLPAKKKPVIFKDLLYQDKITYFLVHYHENSPLTGSSLALASLGRLIFNQCNQKKTVHECLQKKASGVNEKFFISR